MALFVTRLNLLDTNFGDADVHRLSKFSNLRVLELKNTRITDMGILYLSGMANINLQQLECIQLSYTSLTDGCLRHLVKMKHLRGLDLTSTAVHLGVAKAVLTDHGYSYRQESCKAFQHSHRPIPLLRSERTDTKLVDHLLRTFNVSVGDFCRDGYCTILDELSIPVHPCYFNGLVQHCLIEPFPGGISFNGKRQRQPLTIPSRTGPPLIFFRPANQDTPALSPSKRALGTLSNAPPKKRPALQTKATQDANAFLSSLADLY
ncbi:hypothetical protein DM01DRAFT_1339709 [Hesseltinella vesiculosa]|uniref:RNI-like protein n=1 Tax=Hesseltinella vesiculosa TaxID=101127 RepID=A0A1X2G657_9FUNG|nr:hypothetical protein DM01DRAFT_1339709 [Hesseltinella vesiculosa]